MELDEGATGEDNAPFCVALEEVVDIEAEPDIELRVVGVEGGWIFVTEGEFVDVEGEVVGDGDGVVAD